MASYIEQRKRAMPASSQAFENSQDINNLQYDFVEQSNEPKPLENADTAPIEPPKKRQKRQAPKPQEQTRQQRRYNGLGSNRNSRISFTKPNIRAVGHDYMNNDPFSSGFFDDDFSYNVNNIALRRSRWGSKHYIHMCKRKLGENGENLGALRLSFPAEYVDAIKQTLDELMEEIAGYNANRPHDEI